MVDIKNYCLENLFRADGKLNSAKLRQSMFKLSEEYNQIINQTSFLPVTAGLPERVWCILHDVHAVRLCEICSAPASFLPAANIGYSKTCSNPSCKSSASAHKALETKKYRYGAAASPKTRESARLRAPELYTKGRETVKAKYNTLNVSCLDWVKEKKTQTVQRNYGVDNPSQSAVIRQRIIESNRHTYGVDYPQQTEVIREKIRLTCQQNYGVPSHTQKHNPEAFSQLQNYEWLYREYIINQKPAYVIAQELGLSPTSQNSSTVCRWLHFHGFVVRRIRSFSYKAVEWLEHVMKEQDIFIQHALNKGEYTLPSTSITVDGFCSNTNTVYEFHGDAFHGNPNTFPPDTHCHPFDELVTAQQLYKKTMQRDDMIRSMGYNLVIMWEGDWNVTV